MIQVGEMNVSVDLPQTLNEREFPVFKDINEVENPGSIADEVRNSNMAHSACVAAVVHRESVLLQYGDEAELRIRIRNYYRVQFTGSAFQGSSRHHDVPNRERRCETFEIFACRHRQFASIRSFEAFSFAAICPPRHSLPHLAKMIIELTEVRIMVLHKRPKSL